MPSGVLPFQPPPADYYEHSRAEVVVRLPRPLGRVLDIGCGAGGVGRTLRAAGARELVGIELDPVAAARAREVFDEVLEGDAEQVVASLDGQFDTICAYDILEHLYDPAAVVERLRRLAAPGAHFQVSLPNARHYSLLADLVIRGTFGYQSHGHRDVTHLRWFTRRDAERLLRDCGWQVLDTATHELKRSRVLLAALTRGRSTEYIAGQWFVLCHTG
ncbi:MAG: class I SAM-dependent methyltransferase [Actinomycetota bacterium]|nr:class I SAM-dependent methyltransferase [Actinomycetota bacterium]